MFIFSVGSQCQLYANVIFNMLEGAIAVCCAEKEVFGMVIRSLGWLSSLSFYFNDAYLEKYAIGRKHNLYVPNSELINTDEIKIEKFLFVFIRMNI